MRDQPFRLTRELDCGEVDWDAVLLCLERRQRLSPKEAERLLSKFVRNVRSPLNPYWLRRNELTSPDQAIALALCEHLGADRVVLTVERSLRAGILRLAANHRLTLSPITGTDQIEGRGRAQMSMQLSLPGVRLTIDSLRKLLFVHAALFPLAVISFVLIWFCVIYSAAVLVLLLMEPASIARTVAKGEGPGLALLCILVVTLGVLRQFLSGVLSNGKARLSRSGDVRGGRAGFAKIGKAKPEAP